MRLIDADALKYRRQFRIGYPVEYLGKCDILAAPTIDAVPVTRCKDCRYLNTINDPKLYAHCPKTNTVFLPFDLDTREHFCSLGHRKIEPVLPKSDAKDERGEKD